MFAQKMPNSETDERLIKSKGVSPPPETADNKKLKALLQQNHSAFVKGKKESQYQGQLLYQVVPPVLHDQREGPSNQRGKRNEV